MIIKKFTGKTENEAAEQAKKELGQNVVIMNVKNVKKEGFFRFFRPQLVEITVALEEESEKRIEKVVKESKLNQAFAQSAVSEMKNNQIIQEDANDKKDKVIEEKLNSLQSLLEKQLQQPIEKAAEEKETVEEEQEDEEGLRFLKLLYNTMIENEVNEKYANMIIDDLDKTRNAKTSVDVLLANIYQKMILKFGSIEKISAGDKKPKVIFFVGPTGVGKTTTIAKIASKCIVEERKKVALLTADTYRIAAAEQLRTYANILEVPFRIIYSAEEIQSAIKDYQEVDYILIDTGGHSHHNDAQREAMGEFLSGVGEEIEKEVYLVVSATTKYKDLCDIADAYSDMTKYKLIFTKVDETTSLGNLFNLRMHTGASLSYITCGQNVPDDIELFNVQDIVRQLLGGK